MVNLDKKMATATNVVLGTYFVGLLAVLILGRVFITPRYYQRRYDHDQGVADQVYASRRKQGEEGEAVMRKEPVVWGELEQFRRRQEQQENRAQYPRLNRKEERAPGVDVE